MKSFLAAVLFASCAVAASAQTPASPIKISDDEAITLIKTIEGYAQGNKQQIEVFDRKKGGIVKTSDGDKYVIWFVVVRGSLASAYVKETYVKSVNGKPMYVWTKSENGQWSAVVVPDEAPAP